MKRLSLSLILVVLLLSCEKSANIGDYTFNMFETRTFYFPADSIRIDTMCPVTIEIKGVPPNDFITNESYWYSLVQYDYPLDSIFMEVEKVYRLKE